MMFDISDFIQEIVSCTTTEEKIEVFNKWKLDECRVFLFDEEKSNFIDVAKPIKYGIFNMVGLGDYQKIWVIDKNTSNNESNYLSVAKKVHYDLNILTYINNLFRRRNVVDRDDLMKFLKEIKISKLNNNISTALMERYTTELNNELIAQMIESYVYYDSLDFDVFQSNPTQLLEPDKYRCMKQIWEDASDNLNDVDKIQLYNVICCYILKAFIIKNTRNIPTENKKTMFKKYCFEKLCMFLELEMHMLMLFLENDSSVQKVFQKIQVGAKNLEQKVHNIAWDIFHIRLLEINASENCKESVYLHYFATADSALVDVLRNNPIKMMICYGGQLKTIRRFDMSDFLTQEELDFYGSEEEVRYRAEAARDIDFCYIKSELFKELEALLNK